MYSFEFNLIRRLRFATMFIAGTHAHAEAEETQG